MAEIPSVSLKERLEQAILGFGQLAGCVCQGALVQLWRPVLNARTGTCDDLQTKDQPWSIQGQRNSYLDQFRSASQEVTFSAEGDGASAGTVQQAMQRQEVSVFADVCKLPEDTYLRAGQAAKCGVRGSMLVPLFPHKDLTLAGPVAVLELIQLESDISCFPPLFTWLLEKLPMLNLHTPRGIAHWYDRTGRDIMAQPQQPPVQSVPMQAARSVSPALQQQPAAAGASGAAQRSAPAAAAGSEPLSDARPGRGGGCGEAAAAAAAGPGSRAPHCAPHRGSASSAESPAGSGERPRASAQPADKAECSARGKSGAERAAAGDQQRSPGSLASAGTLGNSHVSEAEHQVHGLASVGEEPDEAPMVHRRRTPQADSGEDSGESSGRATGLPFDKVKELFGVSLTEAATRLGVHRQDLVRSCREHNLDGWPRFSMSVNEAARSDGTPVSSLPSDVDAADMAAFVPFGPRAHRTTPASSWHTHSTHRQQGDRGSGGERARQGKMRAAACNSAVAGGHAMQTLELDAEPIGSPQEDGESNDWVGYAKGLMLPVQSPRQARTHWDGLGVAAAAQPPRSANAADSAQRQPPSSCWQKDDPFGDEDWELLRQPLPPQGGVPPSGSTYTGTSLAACLGLHGEHGISAADIVEAAALIGMTPGQPEHATKPETCRRELLDDLNMAAAQSNIDSLASPAEEVRLAFERGVCASARAPFSRQPSSVRSEGQHQGSENPLPKDADLPCSSGTTVSDVAEGEAAEREAVESREEGGKLQRQPGGAGRGRKRGSGRGRGRGRGDRRLAVATARAGRGLGPLRGGGRARLRRILRAAAVPECEPPAQQPESAEAPVELEPAAEHADRIPEETVQQNEVQEDAEEAADAPAVADAPAAAEDAMTPEVSPVLLHSAEPAASEPMLRELYPVPMHSAPARRTRSQPLPSVPPIGDAEEVTSAPLGAGAASSAAPCSSAGAAAASAAAPQEHPQGANAAAPQSATAAAAPASPPAQSPAAAAGRWQPCSRLPSAQPQSAQPAASAAPLLKTAAAAGPGRPRPASNSGSGGGGSRAGEGAPRKRGRPPQMVPHPHTGELVRKRDLIKARIDPETGEQRAMKKRKSKAAAAAPDEDAPLQQEEEEIPPREVTFSGPSRSDKHKRPVKKSRKMIEAEEAQAFTAEAEVGAPEMEAVAAAAAEAAAEPAAEALHGGSVGAAAVVGAQVQQCFDLDAPRPRKAPETPTRGTSALVYMNTPTSRPRNSLLASPTARKFDQEMICDERLPEQLPEPNEAALQNFLADALAFSPPRPLSGTVPLFCDGGSFLDGGGDRGDLVGSPLPRLDHQMFYGGPLGDLGAAAFTELADSSFSFGCFT